MGTPSVYSIYSPLWIDSFAQWIYLLWPSHIPVDAYPCHFQIPHCFGFMCNCNYSFDSDSASSQSKSEGDFFEAKCDGIRSRGWNDEETEGS